MTPKRTGTGARGWRVVFLVLCTVGACLAADLARLHVAVNTDPDYQSYCAISARVNCDTVAASRYSVLWGLPLAIWGLVAYVAMAALAGWGLRLRLPRPTWPFGILFWTAAVAVLFSARLYYVSHVVVESLCPVCVATYLVNVALFGVAWCELRGLGARPDRALWAELTAAPRGIVLFGGSVAVVVVLVAAGLPRYWRVEQSSGPGGMSIGRTAEGHPWIGAPDPVLEIVEFSDYQCPHCLRGHQEMRKLIESRPEEVRLVHRHYPLDPACNSRMRRPLHPHACEYSRLAHCAGEQKHFWEANDYLFANGRRTRAVTAAELARALGLDAERLESCSRGEAADRAVLEDLRRGFELGVRGTPTFIVDGRTHPGRIPDDVLAAALGPATGSASRDPAP